MVHLLMAKEKGTISKHKGKKVGQPNAKIQKVEVRKVTATGSTVPAPLTDPAEATASGNQSNKDGGASWGIEKEREPMKRLSGFIFMCNPSTKLECYQYRVFGLPSGKKEVVEEIKPGAKLFLFDFELKLLYGIYEATSAGKLNLEPAAFRGKYPAQVKFKIFKECLPLPESTLRHVIKENYTGLKFKQELSGKQVRKLLSSFRPLAASSSQALVNASLSRVMPHSATEVPYLPEMQYACIPPVVEPQPVPKVNFLHHGYHRAPAYVEGVNPTLGHQSLPATGSYYLANSQRPSFIDNVAHGVREPPYARYMTIEERPIYDQVTSLEMQYRTIENRAPRDQVALSERQYHQLPLHREAQYRDGMVAYNSNPAVYHQLPFQRDALYVGDNVVPYNSYPAAPAHQYTSSSVSQPMLLAPGISQGTAPISSYYSYTAANRLTR